MAERIEIEIVANTRAFDEAIKAVQAKLTAFGANVERVAATMRGAFTGMSTGFRDVGQSANVAANTVARAQDTIQKTTHQATGAITAQRVAWAALGGIISHWAVSATRAVTGGLSGLVDGSKKLETAVANIGTLVNKSVTDLSTHREAIRQISIETGKSAEDIAKGVYDAVSSGVALADSLEFTRVAARAALAGLTDTNTSVRALTVVQNTYGASAGTTQQIADKLFQTVNVGVITFEQLAANIGKAATSAKLAGLPFNEFLGAIASLTKGGLTAASSLQGINALTNALANPQKRAAEFAKQHGIVLTQQRLATEGLVPIMRELKEKLGDNFEAWRKLFPQQNAARAAMILASDSARGLAADIASVTNASGALGRAAEIQSATVNVAFARLQAAVASKFDELWQTASPTFISIIDEMRKAISSIDTRVVSKAIESIIAGMREWLDVTKDLRDVFKTYLGYLIDAAKLLGRAAVMPIKLTQGAGEAAAGLFTDAPAVNTAKNRPFSEAATVALRMRESAREFGPPSIPFPFAAETPGAPRITPAEAVNVAASLADRGAEQPGAPKKPPRKSLAQRQREAQALLEQEASLAVRDEEEAIARNEEAVGRAAQRDVEASNAESIRRGEQASRSERDRRFAAMRQRMDQEELARGEDTGGSFLGSIAAGFQQGGGIVGGLENAAVTVGAVLQRAGGAVGDFLIDGAKSAGLAFVDLAAQAGMFLVNEFSAMVGAAGSLKGPEFVKAIEGRFNQAREFLDNIQQNLPVLFKMLEPFIRQIGPVLAQAIPVVVKTLADNAPIIAQALVDQLPAIMDAIIASIPTLINGIVKTMPILIQGIIAEVIPRIPEVMIALVTGQIDAFTANIDKFIEALVVGIGRAFERLVDKFNPFSFGDGSVERAVERGAKEGAPVPYRPFGPLGPVVDLVTGQKIEGKKFGGLIGNPMRSMLQAFDVGGMVQNLAQQYGPGAVPVVAHRGEAVITADRWSRIEGLLEDTVRAGSRAGGGSTQVSVRVGGTAGIDRIMQKYIADSVVAEVRRSGSDARTIREVSDGPGEPVNLPTLIPIT